MKKMLFMILMMLIIAIVFFGCKPEPDMPELKPTPKKILVTIYQPSLNPNFLELNIPTDVIITAEIKPDSLFDMNSVKLLHVNSDGSLIADYGYMDDNGDLSKGDEIEGDYVYSIKISLEENSVTTLYFKVSAQTYEENISYSVIVDLPVIHLVTSQEFSTTKTTQDQGLEQMENLIETYGKEQGLEKTAEWIETQTGVTSASVGDDGWIEVEYDWGISGMIGEFSEDFFGADSSNISGRQNNNLTISSTDRGQTIYFIDEKSDSSHTISFERAISEMSISDNIIGSRNALILSPFEYDLNYLIKDFDYGYRLNNLLKNTESPKFNVNYLKNAEVTIDAIRNMTDYGLIFISSHGGTKLGSSWVAIEKVTDINQDKYLEDYSVGKLEITTGMLFKEIVSFHSITPSFIKNLKGDFPNSIVHLTACKGLYKDQYSDKLSLYEEFLKKGVGAVTGYDKKISIPFAWIMANQFFNNLIKDGESIGDAFIPGQIDPAKYHAEFIIKGNEGFESLTFNSSLLNGGFEYGSAGWLSVGDGRIISKIGETLPKEGNKMAILSTGLGFTETSGRIEQSFNIPAGATTLELWWKMYSEEWLEYIGSTYQDYFKITIINDGLEEILINNTIDSVYYDSSLELNPADVSFDQGDVHTTDWIMSSLDISKYQGKGIILILETGDIGDSIFDTAVLIDGINIK